MPPQGAAARAGGGGAGVEPAAEGGAASAPAGGVPPQPPGATPFAAPDAGYAIGTEAAAVGIEPKKSKAPLILGIIGGILVAGGIAVLVLWLTLWRGGAGGTGDPVALAEKYISALEEGDAQAFMDCFQPEYFSMEDNPLLEGMGMDAKKMIEMTLKMSDFDFQGVQLEKESEGGDRAEVVTTAGKLKVSVMGFEQEYDLAEDPMRFSMERKGGRWYLTEDPMPGSMGMDMDLEGMDSFEDMDSEGFEDLNPEDLRELLPEDMNLEDLEELLPEGMNLEELENMSPDELMKLLEELERMLEELPSEGTSS